MHPPIKNLLWAGRPVAALSNAELTAARNTLLRQAKRAHCQLLALVPMEACCPAFEEASGRVTTQELLPPVHRELVEEQQLRDALNIAEFPAFRRLSWPS